MYVTLNRNVSLFIFWWIWETAEINICVIYLHYCCESSILQLLISSLRILPVTSQLPNQPSKGEGEAEASDLTGPALSEGFKTSTKTYASGYIVCK